MPLPGFDLRSLSSKSGDATIELNSPRILYFSLVFHVGWLVMGCMQIFTLSGLPKTFLPMSIYAKILFSTALLMLVKMLNLSLRTK